MKSIEQGDKGSFGPLESPSHLLAPSIVPFIHSLLANRCKYVYYVTQDAFNSASSPLYHLRKRNV
jgi:hypothetical protein